METKLEVGRQIRVTAYRKDPAGPWRTIKEVSPNFVRFSENDRIVSRLGLEKWISDGRAELR
jgi:hypothetical protein